MTSTATTARRRRPKLLTARTCRYIATALVVVASSAGFASAASSGGDTLTLSGPATNVMGADFNYTISGVAMGPADHVAAWEQVNKVNGCATTFAAEAARALLQPAATYDLYLWTKAAVSGSYSVLARFGARNAGVHGICAYLVNVDTGTTYAYDGAFWTNGSAT